MTGNRPFATLGVQGHAIYQQATPDLAIAHLRPTIPEHDIHRHQHADMHLVLLLAGRYVCDAAGMPAVCAEPALIFNPPGTEHRDRFRSRDGLFLTLTMPLAAYDRMRDGLSVGEHATRLPRQSLAKAMGLLRELGNWEATSPLAIESIVSEIMADACVSPRGVGDSEKLQRVLDCLEGDPDSMPSIMQLAQIADHHPVYLARAFRNERQPHLLTFKLLTNDLLPALQ